jgi:hypothetical protein
VHLAHQAGDKVDGIGVTAGTVVSSDKSPEIPDYDRVAVAVGQATDEEVSVRVEGIDLAVAKISDQQVVGESAKPGGRYVEPPRRVEDPAGSDALNEGPVGVELIDKAVARPGNVIVLSGVLRRIADEQVALPSLYTLNGAQPTAPAGTDGGCGSVKLKPAAGLKLLSCRPPTRPVVREFRPYGS